MGCTSGNIRLHGGPSLYEGKLQICTNRLWLQVTSYYWDSRDAEVACRQMWLPHSNTSKSYFISPLKYSIKYVFSSQKSNNGVFAIW